MKKTCKCHPAHSFRVVNEGIFFISISNINQVLNTVNFLWFGTLKEGCGEDVIKAAGEIKLQN